VGNNKNSSFRDTYTQNLSFFSLNF